ncbi:MAG TPA: alpha/beta fold hydrolase, partial [Candidatus Omnitrophota bacterium]|nr:alpha/beta fold hydrolase [Candidatus Omnitrophota bacterium]
MTLEVIRRGEGRPGRPPLLFVHGAFAGAWIWDEHFLPFFAEAGWECVALSLRGHGKSSGHDRLDHFGLHHYVEDVAAIAAGLERPPLVVGHSLGGAVAQRFVSGHPAAGQVLIAASPPQGFSGPAWWMALHRPGFLWQLGLLETLGKRYVDPEVL